MLGTQHSRRTATRRRGSPDWRLADVDDLEDFSLIDWAISRPRVRLVLRAIALIFGTYFVVGAFVVAPGARYTWLAFLLLEGVGLPLIAFSLGGARARRLQIFLMRLGTLALASAVIGFLFEIGRAVSAHRGYLAGFVVVALLVFAAALRIWVMVRNYEIQLVIVASAFLCPALAWTFATSPSAYGTGDLALTAQTAAALVFSVFFVAKAYNRLRTTADHLAVISWREIGALALPLWVMATLAAAVVARSAGVSYSRGLAQVGWEYATSIPLLGLSNVVARPVPPDRYVAAEVVLLIVRVISLGFVFHTAATVFHRWRALQRNSLA
jgi:hypothetical protein